MRNVLVEADRRNGIQGLLMTLVGGLGLSVVALGWRLRSVRRGPQEAGVTASRLGAAPESAGPALTASSRAGSDVSPCRTTTYRPVDAACQADGWPAQDADAEPKPAPPDSVDELIDLEQEADFFELLGDDAAAIDLLEKHIGRRGVSSPLPYLKQMELHRRRGDRLAFDGAASRFGRHFAAEAPRWEVAGGEGGGLQDHPSAVGELQSLWSSPERALDRIESMLFPGPLGACFGLAACQDLLTLYQVARERQRMPAAMADVDLHLPLPADEALAVALSPSVFGALAMAAGTSSVPTVEAADQDGMAALDLDLSEPAPPDQPVDPAAAERSAA